MPVSETATQRTQALALLKRRGMTRLAEISEAGVTATTVSRMAEAGEVVRLDCAILVNMTDDSGNAPGFLVQARYALVRRAVTLPASVVGEGAGQPGCTAPMA